MAIEIEIYSGVGIHLKWKPLFKKCLQIDVLHVRGCTSGIR
jgi:hypothetical protein